MSALLAVDIGRTGCRVAWWDADSVVPDAIANGAGSLGLGAKDGVAAAESAILAVARPLLATRQGTYLEVVGVGIAGALTAPPELARRLAGRLAMSLRAHSVAVASDAITSHAGALGGKPGVVLAAGTGVVAVAIGSDRQLHRIDGWGPWIGDEGGGAWIGQRGLQAVARAQDGRGPATLLSAAAKQQFGSLERIASGLGSAPNPARSLAAFVPAVATAARGGDQVSLQLLADAGTALAHAMLAAIGQLQATRPVAATIIGGLTNLGALLLDPLRATLKSAGTAIQWQSAEGTSLDGARLVAIAHDGIHAPWVVRSANGNVPQTLQPGTPR